MRVPIPENGGIYVCDGRLYKPGYGWSELAYPPPTNSGRLLTIHAQGLTHWLLFFIERLAYKNYVHCTIQYRKTQGGKEKMTTVSIFVICKKKSN